MKVIDFHAHAFPDAIAQKARDFLEDYYHLPMYGNGRLDHLIESSKEGGVSRLVVCSTATTAKQVMTINNWLADVQKKDPYIISLGTVHPDFDNISNEVDRIISLGLHGVKLHPDFQRADILCDGMLEICRCCEGRLPVLIHAGDKKTTYSKPEKIAKLLDIFPNITIIAAHMGGYSEWDDAEKYLLGKNCYIDTSSSLCCLSGDEMTRLIRIHGHKKVLFGTDYPFTGAKQELEQIMSLSLSQNELEDILYNNAAELLKLNE